jgi:uncharacterized repeat protein (TIGR01451 family)
MEIKSVWRSAAILLLLTGVVASPSPPSIRAAGPWYVAPGGSDANSCASPAAPCATVNAAIGKATAGDTIYVAEGTYTGTGTQVVLLDRSVTLSGGWNDSFASQGSMSILDGMGSRRCVTVAPAVTAVIERFTLLGGKTESGGGGIYTEGYLTLVHATLRGNAATGYGGGIENRGTLTLNDTTAAENTSAYNGGGIYNAGTLVVNHSSITANEAETAGGGIANYGSLTLNASSVTRNLLDPYYGAGGGGIVNFGPLALNNSTVSGNTGGGIQGCGSLAASSSTIAGNMATGTGGSSFRGGGIYACGGTVMLQNTIVAGNQSRGEGPDCYGRADSFSTLGYNLVGNTADCGFAFGVDDLTNVEAKLDSLQGSPCYHPLLLESPAINAGNPAGCADNEGSPLGADQRGFPRFGRCDIGAYEVQPLGFSVKTATSPRVFIRQPVTYTIQVSNPGSNVIAGVRVTDTLPISLTYIPGSLSATGGSAAFSNGVVTWTGTVNAAEAVTVTFGAATGAQPDQITNSAVIAGAGEVFTRTASVQVVAPVYLPVILKQIPPEPCVPLYAADFSNPGSGWPVGEDAKALYQYVGRTYRILLKADNTWAIARPSFKASKSAISVDVVDVPQAGIHGVHGIVFGLSEDGGQFYVFDITPDQRYYIARRDPGSNY